MRLYFTVLSAVLLLALSFAVSGDFDAVENQTADRCIPKSVADNPLVMERICENRFDASCSCYENGKEGVECSVDFNDKLTVECEGEGCTATFLGQSEQLDLPLQDPRLVELACGSMASADCSCEETDGLISCSVENAKITSSCGDAGCDLNAGPYSKRFDYCRKDGALLIERTGRLKVKIEGRVKRTEDGRRILEDGVISVSGKLNRDISVEIAANLDSVEESSDVRAQRAEIKKEVREKFRKALKLKYKTENFNTLDAVDINLSALKDGEHIKSAVVRFKVPKTLVDGEVVILRYDDEGSVETLTPKVTERGSYNIYEVSTGGLSLYAVATVQQISKPLAESGETPTSPVCGTAGLILLMGALLYTVRARM